MYDHFDKIRMRARLIFLASPRVGMVEEYDDEQSIDCLSNLQHNQTHTPIKEDRGQSKHSKELKQYRPTTMMVIIG
jgi:hypothetical protein